jgi:hypothetical protein
VSIAFGRGQYSVQVATSAGLPERRQVALDVAARQQSALPDYTAPPATGEEAAYELGRAIASLGISVGMLVLMCVAAVAIVRSFRRMSSPPSQEGLALAGPRRRGSTI